MGGHHHPVPFVVGSGRSGTTLLRAMLDQHPELAIPPEAHFLPAMVRDQHGGRHHLDPEAFVARLRTDRWFLRWDLPPASLEEALGDGPLTLGDALRTLYGLYAAREGKIRWGDKTPPAVLHAVSIGGVLPEARFVHVLRDGRAVAASLQEVGFGPDDPAAAAAWWRRHVARGRRGGRRLGPDRYLEVRYEDLVSDPEPVLRRICAFIHLDFSERMLEFERNADRMLAGAGRPGQHARLAGPLDPEVRSGARSLESGPGLDIAHGLLHQLGYVEHPPSGSRRALGNVRFASIELRRLALRFRPTRRFGGRGSRA